VDDEGDHAPGLTPRRRSVRDAGPDPRAWPELTLWLLATVWLLAAVLLDRRPDDRITPFVPGDACTHGLIYPDRFPCQQIFPHPAKKNRPPIKSRKGRSMAGDATIDGFPMPCIRVARCRQEVRDPENASRKPNHCTDIGRCAS
jgi:hypothetical protein